MNNYNRGSYRDSDLGESYGVPPRIISSHLRLTYSKLIHITDNINFNSPIFNDMGKRNRSLGSTQAFICELALADRRFVNEKIKPFCIGEGINILIANDYMDNLYFDRLSTFKNNMNKVLTRNTSAIIQPSPTTSNMEVANKLYYK